YMNLLRLANPSILVFEPGPEIILDVKDKGCAEYGFAHEGFIGRSLKELTKDVERGERFMAELIATGHTQSYESINFRANGEPVLFQVSASVIEYEGRKAILTINRDITEQKRAEEQLLHDAFHDGLTGLANRSLFMEHLRITIAKSQIRGSKPFAVLYLDFDRFKMVNDSLGHAQGDKLLQYIARRVEKSTRSG